MQSRLLVHSLLITLTLAASRSLAPPSRPTVDHCTHSTFFQLIKLLQLIIIFGQIWDIYYCLFVCTNFLNVWNVLFSLLFLYDFWYLFFEQIDRLDCLRSPKHTINTICIVLSLGALICFIAATVCQQHLDPCMSRDSSNETAFPFVEFDDSFSGTMTSL